MANEQQQNFTLFLGQDNNILMSLDERNGRVGIAMSNPAYKLDIQGNLRLNQEKSTKNKLLVLYDEDETEDLVSGTNFFGLGCDLNNLRLQVPYEKSIKFYSGTNEILTVNGYSTAVGINIANPQAHLHVNGSTICQEHMWIGGICQVQDYFSANQGALFNGDVLFNNNVDVNTLVVHNQITMSNNTGKQSIYSSNNFIGINNTNPSYLLDVSGDIGGDRIYLGRSTYTAAPRVNLQNAYSTASIGVADQPARFHALASNGDLVIRQNAGKQIIFGTAFNSPTFVMSNNLVGINRSPAYQLDVKGTVRIDNSTNNKLLILNDGDPNESISSGTNFYGFGVNPSAFRYQAPLYMNHVFYNGPYEVIRFEPNLISTTKNLTVTGTVGIGTATPAYKLDVNGDINFMGNLYKNGVLYRLDSQIPSELKTNFIYLGSNNYELNPGIQLQNVHSTFKMTLADQAGRFHSQANSGDMVFVQQDASKKTIFGSDYNKTGICLSNNLVGIGTTMPKGLLHLTNGTTSNNIVMDTSIDGFSFIAFNGHNNGGENVINTSKTRYRLYYDMRGTSDKMVFDYYNLYQAGPLMMLDASGTIGIPKNMKLLFAYDYLSKDAASGTIAYQLYSFDALDIVGAGSDNTQRRVQIYDMLGIGRRPNYTLDVNGNINFTGNLYKNGIQIDLSGGGGGGSISIPDPLMLNGAQITNLGSSTITSATINGNNIQTLNLNVNNDLKIGASDAYYNLTANRMTISYDGGPQRSEMTIFFRFQNTGSPDPSSTSHQFHQSGLCNKRNNTYSWDIFSDYRLKENIQTLENGLDVINRLRPVSYEWKNKALRGDGIYNGFVAQEFQQVLPECVKEISVVDESEQKLLNDDKCLVLSPDLIPHLVSAVKELHEMVRTQQNQIDELKQIISLMNT